MYKPIPIKNKKISLFQTTDKKVIEVTAMVLKDYLHGTQIQTRPRPEFDNRSLLQEINVNQKAFNSYVAPRSDDPDESWKAQTVRPITRNKLISIAAHVTGTMLYPGVFAQNKEDEEDRDAALVMKDLVEWVIDNSNYPRTFIRAVISALVDPAVIVSSEFLKVMRKVKEMKDDGTFSEKEILDEVMSGFFFNTISIKQILISNFYEPDIQKQRFIIKNKYVDFEEAKIVHGHYKNFKYVKAGVRAVFDDQTKTFYEVTDDDMKNYLVNEITYYNRALDLELIFINGILMCNAEKPLVRKDKKYPFAKSGFEPLGNGQCFYYKSAANKLGSDQEIVDTLYNMVLDGTFLQLMPPMALYGSEEIDGSVTVPGTITSFRDKETKLENIGPRSDLRAGLETISMVERSIAESTQDNIRSGVSGGGDRTAREVLLLEKNAAIALGLFGKEIKFLVEDLGDLLIPDIVQNMTVGEVDQITDGMKFRSFVLPNKNVDGKNVSKKIKFVNPSEVSDYTDPMEESFRVFEDEGGPEGKSRISEVNSSLFRTLKFKTRVSADELTPPSKALTKALDLEAYDRLIQNPTINQESVTRDFLLDVYRPGQADKYIQKQQPAAPVGMDMGNKEKQSSVNTSMLSQITGSNSLGNAASAV